MKTLMLLRHAEAEKKSAAGDDHARALTERGREEARRVGRWLRERRTALDAALVSDAARARQTYEAARQAFPALPEPVFSRRLYLATPGELFALLQGQAAAVAASMLVGHNPGIQDLCRILAESGPAAS